jgi:hypothetical protein
LGAERRGELGCDRTDQGVGVGDRGAGLVDEIALRRGPADAVTGTLLVRDRRIGSGGIVTGCTGRGDIRRAGAGCVEPSLVMLAIGRVSRRS